MEASGHLHVANIEMVVMLTTSEIMSMAINTVVHLGRVCCSVMARRCVVLARSPTILGDRVSSSSRMSPTLLLVIQLDDQCGRRRSYVLLPWS